ncbi:DNA-binding protein [Thermococcus prieurii]
MVCLTPEELVEEFRQRLFEWGKENYVEWPWRRNRTPYKVLIAELLLKRTTRQAAAREYQKFITKFPDIESIHRANFDEIKEAFRPLGLYNQRAKQLKELAEVLIEKYGGKIPDNLEALKSLPGVNDYIAGAVLSFGFGKPAPIPDANVLRIMSRVTGFSRTSTSGRRKIYRVLEVLVPRNKHVEFNYALLDLGGSVCHYQWPKCKECPLKDLCVYGTQDEENREYLEQVYEALSKVGKRI